MLLPSGRWNGHYRVGGFKLADVIANWQMLLPSVIIFYFKFWDVKQNLIPYMWQMVFAYISIQGWIIDPYE